MKASNNEQEFAYTAEDNDDNKRNRKDTLKMIYNPERFFMSKMYYLEDRSKLFDSDAIC